MAYALVRSGSTVPHVWWAGFSFAPTKRHLSFAFTIVALFHMSVSKTVAVLHQTLGFGSKLLFPAPAKIYFCDRSVRMNARKATQHLSILSSFVLRNAGLMLRVHAIIHVVKYHWAAKHGHVWECGNLGYFQQPFARPLEPQTMKRQMSLGWFFLAIKNRDPRRNRTCRDKMAQNESPFHAVQKNRF